MPSVKILYEDGTDIEHVNIDDPETLSNLGAYWHQVGNFLAGQPNDLYAYGGMEINGRYVEIREDVLSDWVAEDPDILVFDEMYDE